MKREKIVTAMIAYATNKVAELGNGNPIIMVIKPAICRIINNNIGKVDDMLKLLEDSKGEIDIECIISEMIDNLITVSVKEYPNVLNGIKIGDGNIIIDIPFIDKGICISAKDIQDFNVYLKNNY